MKGFPRYHSNWLQNSTLEPSPLQRTPLPPAFVGAKKLVVSAGANDDGASACTDHVDATTTAGCFYLFTVMSTQDFQIHGWLVDVGYVLAFPLKPLTSCSPYATWCKQGLRHGRTPRKTPQLVSFPRETPFRFIQPPSPSGSFSHLPHDRRAGLRKRPP